MTIKTQGGKVITKDGKVSCECCGGGGCECGNLAGAISLTKQQYNTFRLGGDWIMNAVMNESYQFGGDEGCSVDITDSGMFLANSCSNAASVVAATCSDTGALFTFIYRVCGQNGSYFLTWFGFGRCSSLLFDSCYSIGYTMDPDGPVGNASQIGELDFTFHGMNFLLPIYAFVSPPIASVSANVTLTVTPSL